VPRNKPRFIPFQMHQQWGVLDRQSGELVQKQTKTERYPEAWARTRAAQLNKDQANAVHQSKGPLSKGDS